MSRQEAETHSVQESGRFLHYLKAILAYGPRWYEDTFPEGGRWLGFPTWILSIPYLGAWQVRYVIEGLHLSGFDYAEFMQPGIAILLSLATTYFLIPRWHAKFSLFLCIGYTIFTILSGIKFIYGYNALTSTYIVFSFMFFFTFHVQTSACFWGSIVGIPIAFTAYALMPKSRVRFWQSEPEAQ